MAMASGGYNIIYIDGGRGEGGEGSEPRPGDH